MPEREEMDQSNPTQAEEPGVEMYRLLADAIPDVICIFDLDAGCMRYVSSSVTRLLGYTVQEALAMDLREIFTPASYQLIQEQTRVRVEAYRRGERVNYADELCQIRKDGTPVWTETTIRFQTNQTSGHLELYSVSRDITGRRLNDALIKLRLDLVEIAYGCSIDEFLQIALDKIAAFTDSPIAFYHFVEPDQITISLQAWSTRTLREFCKAEGKGMQYALDEAGVWVDCVRERRAVIHNDYASLAHRKGLPPGHAPLIRELVVPVFRGETVVSILGVGNKHVPYTETDIQVVSYLADVVWEVGKRKQVEQTLSELQARLHLLSQNLENAGLYVYAHDTQSKPHFEYLSASMEALTGVKIEDALRDASAIHSLILPEYLAQLKALEEKSKRNLVSFEMEVCQRHAVTGEIHWMLLRSTPRTRPDGSTVWYGVQMDITERKRSEHMLEEANQQLRLQMREIEQLHEDLREQSIRDPLTGLYNRRYLTETLGREIARAERENRPLSIVISDIDSFKLINDTFGHRVGDQFLIEIADLMNKNARRSDIICRFGGEEFLLVLPGTTVESALRRAEEIRQKCVQLLVPQNGSGLRVSMSFGVATYPVHGKEAEEIIIKADRALYRSKETGRNRVTVWQDAWPPPEK